MVARCCVGRYKRNLIHLERTREKQMMNLQTGTPFETVTLTTIGRERKLFFDIIEEGTSVNNIHNNTGELQFYYPLNFPHHY